MATIDHRWYIVSTQQSEVSSDAIGVSIAVVRHLPIFKDPTKRGEQESKYLHLSYKGTV